MSNDARPEIRFPGFTEDWEERKFGLLFEKNLEKNKNSEFDASRTISIATMHFKEEGNGAAESSLATYKVLRVGDIAYEGHTSKQFAFGRFVLNDIGDGIMSPRFTTLRPTSERPISFWKQYIHYEPIMRHLLVRSTKNGTMMNELVIPDLEKESLLVPSESEQKQIGAFFDKLDETITLHQRKLDLLKETKKGFLQKMFPKNGAKVPEIRFPGFTEDWEQRKLGEVVERVTRKNKKLESIRPLTISAQEGLIDQNEFFNKTVASRDVSGYYLVKKGEFAYNKSYSNGYPWGAVKRLNQYDMGVLSTLYIVFKPKKIDSDFLEKYYDTTYWYKEVSKHAAEGARNHGLLNIAASDFFETEIVMPLKIEEQQKIGNFFKQLDDTITLHQRKLDLLKEMKKGFLQKMFV